MMNISWFKNLCAVTSLVLIATVSFTQKPLKTFKEKKFAKKVILSMAPSLMHKVCPDQTDIEYLSESFEISEDEVIAYIKRDTARASADAKWLNDHQVWRKLEDVELKNEKTQKGVRSADVILHCSYKGKSFDLVLKECYQTKRSWYIGKGIIPQGKEIQDIVDDFWKYRDGEETSEENTMEVAETKVVEYNSDETSESAEAVEDNDLMLPEKFKDLPATWQFKAVFDGDKNMTEQYKKGFLEGKPIKMAIMQDGSVIYQKGYRDRNHIEYAEWKYLAEDEREEDEQEIDFTIKIYNDEGGYGKEKYSLVTVGDELIYENMALNMRWVWTKK